MAEENDEDLKQDILLMLTAQVRAGYRDREQIWLHAEDMCEEAGDGDALRQFASETLERLWREQRAAEAGWFGRTDCERLDQAFEELETTGIVCRQDFTCCNNCGEAEIGDEFEAVEGRGIKVRGYAYFHAQDTERAVEGQGVYLSYGANARGDAAGVAIGREIVAVLTAYGLKPNWNGKLAQRIHVPLEWRRRFGCVAP
ncbi:MAG TPA: hypothetical protein PLK37_12155 [Terricaulis sp.]|nr:hypothetical protein [Terricaulis sp.]